MSFNFPSSPVDGATYSPAGGPTYTFSNGTWNLGSSTNPYGYVLKTGDTMTGALTINRSDSAAYLTVKSTVSHNGLVLDKPVGAFANSIVGRVNSLVRWTMYLGSTTAESGSGNTGSNFFLYRHDDAGGTIDLPMFINRSDGIVQMPLGAITATQAPSSDSSTKVATTAFVQSEYSSSGVDSVTDWNTISTPGWFPTLLGNGNANAPTPGGTYFYCRVTRYSTNFTQIAYPYSTPIANLAKGIWWRGWHVSTGWTPWYSTTYTTADTRNRIVNGAMQISQENGISASGATGGYCAADQWFGSTTTATGVAVFEHILSNSFQAQHRVRLRCTTAQASIAAAEYSHFYQPIEGIRMSDFKWGQGAAVPVVLRFAAYADQAGTCSVSIRDSVSGYSFVANFPVSGAQTNVVIPIPVPPSGTWTFDNSKSMLIGFCLAAGSTFITASPNTWVSGNFLAATGITNGLSALSNTLNIWNVGLYADPLGTGLAPPWQAPDEAQELAACMRYWERITGTYFSFNANVTTANTYYATGTYLVTKRAVPTMSGVDFGGALSFPATVGSIGSDTTRFNEGRLSNATNIGRFYTTITANARMP